MSSLNPSSKGSVPDTIRGVNESASDPSHIEGRATPAPTPFDWREFLTHFRNDDVNHSVWFQGHMQPSTAAQVVIMYQLAELLNFLNRIQIPAWLLKKK